MTDDTEYSGVPGQESSSTAGRKYKWNLYYVSLIIFVILFASILTIVFSVLSNNAIYDSKREPPDPETALPPSPSREQRFSRAAVCSDAVLCSAIGRDILKKSGTAVDAAIATLFCNGLVNSQSMGIGGGFLMVIYDQKNKEGQALIARETAPMGVSEDIYRLEPDSVKSGGKAVGVPGELRGYWAAHRRYGRLPWAELVAPTIELCENGYPMPKHQYDSLKFREKYVRKDPLLRATFVNESTGEFFREGTIIKLQEYCETLRIISLEGGDSLYNGTLSRMVLDDIRKNGGIITEEDLNNYQVLWTPALKQNLRGGITILGTPPPGSGALLAFILEILDGFNINPEDFDSTNRTILTYHRIVESFKFAFAKRGMLADPSFVDTSEVMNYLSSCPVIKDIREKIDSGKVGADPRYYGAKFYSNDDHGTAHVSVIDAKGNAVSVTSSVNLYFGAGITSAQTGIILNSGIDDFSFPWFENFFGLGWSPANRLQPGKRSLSSMCPTIVLENGRVRLAVGASGGTKITTAVALVIIRHLWLGEDLKAAVDASRFHHQLIPPTISYEYGMLKDVREGLETMGHNFTRYRDRGSIVCALASIGDYILGNADYRKGGEVFGI